MSAIQAARMRSCSSTTAHTNRINACDEGCCAIDKADHDGAEAHPVICPSDEYPVCPPFPGEKQTISRYHTSLGEESGLPKLMAKGLVMSDTRIPRTSRRPRTRRLKRCRSPLTRAPEVGGAARSRITPLSGGPGAARPLPDLCSPMSRGHRPSREHLISWTPDRYWGCPTCPDLRHPRSELKGDPSLVAASTTSMWSCYVAWTSSLCECMDRVGRDGTQGYDPGTHRRCWRTVSTHRSSGQNRGQGTMVEYLVLWRNATAEARARRSHT